MKHRLQRLAAVGLLVLSQLATSILVPRSALALGGSFDWVSKSYTGDVLNDNNGAGAVPQGISSDGRYVLFSSYATNVVPNDTNGHNDLFRRDRLTGTSELVSVTSTGVQGNGDVLRGDGAISGDGRYVVFGTFATNLGPSDFNNALDIFYKDMQTGALTRVCSSQFNGFDCTNGSISRDGRYITYQLTTLFSYNNQAQIFRYDRTTGQSQLVSQNAQGQAGNQGGSGWSRMSADGRYVVFDDFASNLVTGDTNNKLDIFRRDMATGEVVRINVTPSGVQANADSEWPTISDDGRYVVFPTVAANFAPNDTNGNWDLYIKDTQLNTLQLVGNVLTASSIGTIVGDGSQVVFETSAKLVPNDTDPYQDVYAWDRVAQTNTRLTQHLDGSSLGQYGAGSGSSSPDGRYALIFTNNMIDPADTTPAVETYVYDRGPSDTAPPVVSGVPNRAANAVGWYDNDVTITWSATDPDPSSGTPTTPSPTLASQEGVHTYASAQSCDPAGNCATGSLALSIDKTKPTIAYSVSPLPNTAGWNNASAVVTFTCADSISGVASCTNPVTVQEGANQTVTGTAADLAGNTVSVSVAVNVDATKPTIAYTTVPAAPNAAGWFNGNVTLSFDCADGLSGLLACTAPVTLSDEGAGQTASGSATDVAGNEQTVTTAAINIDKSAPQITHALSAAPNTAGWNNSDVTVTFDCSDAISGVTSCTSPTTLGEGANQTVTGTAYDLAGNGQNDGVTLSIDKTMPTISYSLSQVPNFFGWNNASVIVTFNCADALSGLASCSDPITVGEGANQTITGTASDVAGNTATVNLSLSIDSTKPTISYGLLPAMPNAAGWYNTDVTVHFNCLDFLSGVGLCSDPVTLATDGANQSASGSVTDLAFNTDSVTVGPINIDKTAPTLSSVTLANNPLAVNQTTTLSAQVSDATSGIARAEYFVDAADPGLGNATTMAIAGGTVTATVGSYTTAGLHTFSVRTQDVAGNWSAIQTVNLDVYNPAAGYVAGHGFVTPSGTTSDSGDTLPAVNGNNVKATLDFTVKYATTTATAPTGSSLFTWGSGNCKKANNTCFVAEVNSLSWLIIPGNGTAVFQGLATVSLNGQSTGTNYPMRVSVTDGGLVGPDHYLLRIYPSASDPDAATPLYQASGDLTGGDIRLHP